MTAKSHPRPLILASSSPYRKLMLERLGLAFDTATPDIDETPRANEDPHALVARLAAAKAAIVAKGRPDAIVIGSDQVAVHHGAIVGKPGTAERARRQLRAFSGGRVEFLSAVCLRCVETGWQHAETVQTEVEFRRLSDREIERYVELDDPVDCAGGFRSEAAGSMLLRALHSTDPTAIIGLPLIAVCGALRGAGFELP